MAPQNPMHAPRACIMEPYAPCSISPVPRSCAYEGCGVRVNTLELALVQARTSGTYLHLGALQRLHLNDMLVTSLARDARCMDIVCYW